MFCMLMEKNTLAKDMSQKLEALEERLKKIISPEKMRELELEAIKQELDG